MTLRFFPALITREPGSDFGVVFPDFLGCISEGNSVQQAAEHAVEALSLHIEGMLEAGLPVPAPSAPDAALPDWLASAPMHITTWMLVPVELPGRTIRANISLDEGLMTRLDAAATAEGMSRSGYIAQAVRERLRLAKRECAPVSGVRQSG